MVYYIFSLIQIERLNIHIDDIFETSYNKEIGRQ